MKELKDLDPNNKKYYLLDNARVHKTKKFNKFSKENDLNMIYNALYTKKKILFFLGAHNIYYAPFRNKSN